MTDNNHQPTIYSIPIQQYVNIDEYNRLQKENIELKTRILQLHANEKILQEVIITREKTIDELKDANEKLKKRLEILEKQYNEIKIQYNEIKQENHKIKQENHEIKQQFKINLMKEQYKQYIIAIQDVNRIGNIETKIDVRSRGKLSKLRKNRVSEYHYLVDVMDEDEINDRRTILLEKLKNMDICVKELFDKKYPYLIKDILHHIVSNKTEPSDESLNDINDWWEI
jgi:hypothetical protein